MFGYIVTDRDQLSRQEQLQYRSYYCGLCRTLKERFGPTGQMALNFDMTFLYMLLCSLYEPQERVIRDRCAVHPLKKRDKRLTEYADYCADMTVLLAYYNALDDWLDDGSHRKKRYADKLAVHLERLRKDYPRQCQAVAEGMAQIDRLERQDEILLDAVANCFGKMMGEIFVPKEDNWQSKLYALGENLGKFIYFMDAWEDAGKDARHKNYNPLLQLKGRTDYNKMCEEILRIFLGEAALCFEALPIVENAHILRNILYAGVWSKFRMKE